MKKRGVCAAVVSVLCCLMMLGACAEQSVYAPGTYTGTAAGFGGMVSVEVEVDESCILSIKATGDEETKGIGSEAVEKLPNKMVEANSADVEGVSGATFTSEALKQAVGTALKQAQGEVVAEKASYKPGTYTATAMGKKDFVTAAVTFTEDAIAAIEIVEAAETKGVADEALYGRLIEEIIQYQSVGVDSVTGCTITSNAVKKIVIDCAAQAGAEQNAVQKEVAYIAPETENLSADVVIIGGGGAGMTAAVAATGKGASVIVVEKAGYIGGNSLVCGGIFNVANPEDQSDIQMTNSNKATVESALNMEPRDAAHAELINAVKAEYDEYLTSGNTGLFDSPNWHALQTWQGGDFVGDVHLIRNYTQKAVDAYQWLNTLGLEWCEGVTTGAGALWSRTVTPVLPSGTGYFALYEEELEGKDFTLLLETTAHEILMENGKAVGIRVTDNKTGKDYDICANSGVVIATGGFSGNADMVAEYNTSGKWPDLSSVGHSNISTITGDGIRMGLAVGAAVRDMDQIQLLHMSTAKRDFATSGSPMKGVGAESMIFLNMEGKRFVREDGRRDEISLKVLEQTGAEYWIVYSGNSVSKLGAVTDVSNRTAEYLVGKGMWFRGDTLEELCQQININYESAKADIDAYNKLVAENATVDEFGRATFSTEFTEGPWIAYRVCPQIHHTMGGLVINENTQVLNTNGTPIDGLFAAGEVTGGIHGGNRLGGNAVTDFIVHGMIAGENAVAQ